MSKEKDPSQKLSEWYVPCVLNLILPFFRTQNVLVFSRLILHYCYYYYYFTKKVSFRNTP